MNRILLAAVVAALAYASPMRADDKSDKPVEKPKSRAAQLSDLQQEMRKMMPEVVTAFRAAKNQEERDKALAKFDPIREKGFKLVEENPKDDVSFNTLTFLMQTAPTPPQKVLDMLGENFANDSKFAQLVYSLVDNPGAGKLIKAAEGSTNKSVKAAVALARANKKAESVDEARGDEASKLSSEAEQMLVKVVKEFGNTPLLGSTVEKMANKTLFFVRNLGVGKAAPETVGHNLEGKDDKLGDYKGKVVVLDIWATWCGPCRAMIPHEREMVEKLKDKPFALISISADNQKKDLEQFLEKEKMPWTHWWEGPGENGIVGKWNVRYFPTIYVLDSKGVIRYKHVRGKELEEAVTKLLEEMEKK